MLTIIGAIVASEILDLGIFVVFLALAAAIVMVARLATLVKAHLPGISLEVGQINQSTNGVKEGEPKLIDQVRNLGAGQESLTRGQRKIEENQHTLRDGQITLREGQHELGDKLLAHIQESSEELKRIDQRIADNMQQGVAAVRAVAVRLDALQGPTAPTTSG